ALMSENTTVANSLSPSGPGQPVPNEAVRGRYPVLHLHAKGGLGEVFVARDAELHRQVALKCLQLQFKSDTAACTRVLLESEITARLEPPGVFRVYGLAPHPDGTTAYVMRFIEGETLDDAIKRLHSGQAAGGAPEEGRRKRRSILRAVWDGWVFWVA